MVAVKEKSSRDANSLRVPRDEKNRQVCLILGNDEEEA
jgi:hypothetical protein